MMTAHAGKIREHIVILPDVALEQPVAIGATIHYFPHPRTCFLKSLETSPFDPLPTSSPTIKRDADFQFTKRENVRLVIVINAVAAWTFAANNCCNCKPSRILPRRRHRRATAQFHFLEPAAMCVGAPPLGGVIRIMTVAGVFERYELATLWQRDRAIEFPRPICRHAYAAATWGTWITVCLRRWLSNTSPQGHRIRELGFCDAIRSLPARSTMYPSPISRALCSAGITAGGSSAVVSPTLSSEANSSRVSFSDREAIIRVSPFSVVGAWSILLAFDAYCSMILESVNKSWLLSVALRPLFLKMRMPCKYPAQRQPVRTFNPQLKCRA
jgi:hypothetical protein